MSALEILWLITKVLLASAALTAALTMLIALFHPLKFDLKLRASIKGQRAELWFVYLFRILKIGIIATPHTQDVVVKVLFWKKRLDRQQRSRPPAPNPPADHPAPPDSGTPAPAATQPVPTFTATTPASEVPPQSSQGAPETVTDEAETITPVAQHDTPAIITEPEVSSSSVNPQDSISASASHQPEPQAIPAPEINAATPLPVDVTPLKPLAQVDTEQKTSSTKEARQQKTSAATAAPSWRQKLRKFKSDLSRRYRQLQKHLRLFRQKWRLLFPVLKRFWNRGKKAFGLSNLSLMLRYALHEPYLTGMMQGSMSVFAGLANRFGVNFAPVPTFAEPGVYSKGTATAIIRPWRLCFAAIGLLFEKHLWQELWLAFKWYRSRKTTTRPV